MHDALAFEMARQRLPPAGLPVRPRPAGPRRGVIVIGVIRLGRRFCFRLPRLPGGREQRQLIRRKLLALAVPSGIQQFAQQALDFVSLGELPVQLRHQVQHHLLEDLGIFRKVFGVESHE